MKKIICIIIGLIIMVCSTITVFADEVNTVDTSLLENDILNNENSKYRVSDLVELKILGKPLFMQYYETFNENEYASLQDIFNNYKLTNIENNETTFTMYFNGIVSDCILIFSCSDERSGNIVIAKTEGPNGEVCSLVTNGQNFSITAIL